VKFKKLHEEATLPSYSGSSRSAGMDLYALLSYLIQPGHSVLVDTGVAVQLPEGYEGQVRPRSGLAAKNQITVLNTPGTIDEDYRGEIKVILINLGKFPFTVHPKDKVAQLVVKQVEYHQIEEVSEFIETYENDRGTRGFGSSGR
jgi:dUTP pyrophosphatase